MCIRFLMTCLSWLLHLMCTGGCTVLYVDCTVWLRVAIIPLSPHRTPKIKASVFLCYKSLTAGALHVFSLGVRQCELRLICYTGATRDLHCCHTVSWLSQNSSWWDLFWVIVKVTIWCFNMNKDVTLTLQIAVTEQCLCSFPWRLWFISTVYHLLYI